MIFIGIVVGFYYTSAHNFDEHGYSWAARIIAFFYVIFQQIILIDFAYTMNERMITFAEADTSENRGNKWYIIILLISFFLFAGSLSAIGVMYWQFHGCSSNNVIISLALVFSFIATICQVFFSEEGSLLTSAIITVYSTYICYSAITLNPYSSCNPTISTSYQTVSTAIGLAILVVSISWATYSALKKIPGIASRGTSTNKDQVIEDASTIRPILQEASTIFILVSAYYAMVLTNWATLQASYQISNPRYGEVAMWLQATACWVAFCLYVWTLFAPKIFPDREF